MQNPEGHSCLQLAGAARGGRDAEGKTEDALRESKSSDDDEYVRVAVPHAKALKVSLDTSSKLPRNRQLFVKREGEAGRGAVVLRSMASKPRILETPHPYENSRDEYTTIEFPNCKGMTGTFDPLRKTENG